MRSGRRRGATALLVLVVIAAVAGYVYGSTRGGSSQTPSSQAPVKAHPQASSREAAQRAHLGAELQHGVDAAAALGGTAEAAIMLDGWPTPLIVSSEADGEGRFMRMWSMSKVSTMIAVLHGLGWGRRPGRPISPSSTRPCTVRSRARRTAASGASCSNYSASPAVPPPPGGAPRCLPRGWRGSRGRDPDRPARRKLPRVPRNPDRTSRTIGAGAAVGHLDLAGR